MSGFAGFNKPVLAALIALAGSVANIAGGGTSELPSRRLAAGVTLGGGRPERRATGGAWGREQRFLIEFSYRLGGEEQAAEEAICDAVDLFTDAVLADVTLGGLVFGSEVDHSIADQPDYQRWNLQERRIYPVVVTVRQATQIPLP